MKKCIQLLDSRRAIVGQRVTVALEAEPMFRRKNGERMMSVRRAVLKAIVDAGVPVRRAHLKDVLALGGDKHERVFIEQRVSDNELKRALESLEAREFIERKKEIPRSKRTPGRKKYDLYYRVHPRFIMLHDVMGKDEVEQPFSSLPVERIREVWGNPLERERLIRRELEGGFREGMTEEEFHEYMENIGFLYGRDDPRAIEWWAKHLPPEEKRTRSMVLRCLERQAKRDPSLPVSEHE